MNTSSDAAEQVVRISLEGVELAAKISGAGAKQLAVMLYAILRDQKKTKGKMRLANMLKSGKELKVFAVKDADLQKFCNEAKKYGVLYCVLKDKDAADGITDIMVRAEDASKINRIFERFKLATVDMASVRKEIGKVKEEKAMDSANSKGDKDDRFIDEMMKKPEEKEHENSNPEKAKTVKSLQSEPSLNSKAAEGTGIPDNSRPSVRKELAEIKAMQKEAANKKQELGKTDAPINTAVKKKKGKVK